MEVLAYLIGDDAQCKDNGRDRILRQSNATTFKEDEEMLQQCSKLLLGTVKEATYDTLHEGLPFKWWNLGPRWNFDVVNPFGDCFDEQHQSMWVFDVPGDVLHYTNNTSRGHMPLNLLRQRAVTLADMALLEGPFPPPVGTVFDSSEMPFWKPQIRIDERLRAFMHRLLHDLHFSWRTIFRNTYNDKTLRVLAQGILALATLRFNIREGDVRGRGRGDEVGMRWGRRLPHWEPLADHVVQLGVVHIITCLSLEKGLSVAQEHAACRESDTIGTTTSECDQVQPRYMILSVRHIMLCYVDDSNSLHHTAPEPLFNGDYTTSPPSKLGMDYLIWATASARPLPIARLQLLPVELQNSILLHATDSPMQAAKLGCLLGLGYPYLWQNGSRAVRLASTEGTYYLKNETISRIERQPTNDIMLMYLTKLQE